MPRKAIVKTKEATTSQTTKNGKLKEKNSTLKNTAL